MDLGLKFRRQRQRKLAQIRFMHATLFLVACGLIIFAMSGCARKERSIIDELIHDGSYQIPTHEPLPAPFVQVRAV